MLNNKSTYIVNARKLVFIIHKKEKRLFEITNVQLCKYCNLLVFLYYLFYLTKYIFQWIQFGQVIL